MHKFKEINGKLESFLKARRESNVNMQSQSEEFNKNEWCLSDNFAH